MLGVQFPAECYGIVLEEDRKVREAMEKVQEAGYQGDRERSFINEWKLDEHKSIQNFH